MQAQLAQLRSRIAKIDQKFANSGPRVSASNPIPYRPARYFPEDWLNGHEVVTDFGKHFESEKLYERQRRHGSIGITDLESLPHDLLAKISTRIINEVKGVNRVVYDISSKPPATIEWE